MKTIQRQILRVAALLVGVLALTAATTVAQDTPVGPVGTQLATEETPVAAANADELRKEAQNPIASLISVPVQNNNNLGINPGNRAQDVLNIQPVIPLKVNVNYNMRKGWYLTAQPIITANWNTPAPSGSVWTVPFGAGVGRIMKLGFQPVNINVQAYGNAVHAPGASPWGVRATFALLFPKLTKQHQMLLLEQKLKQMEQQPPQK